MQLVTLIEDIRARNSELRALDIPRDQWDNVIVYAQSPFAKTSEVSLTTWEGRRTEAPPENFEEFALIVDLDEWLESFEGRPDPTQELIDYVIDLSESIK